MKKRILYLLLAIAGFMQFACKKNNGGGQPVITDVRAVDSTKRDSFFVKAYPGNEIVLVGANLDGAESVIFNDTSAYFNPVYNTSTSLIVVIPASAQTQATNPKVPNTIKVITNHGTATFTFTLVLPPPFITSIAFDNTGTEVFINGANFAGISKITFPGGDTALGYTVNKGFTQIAALIPTGSGITDSIRVYCTYGVASFPFPPPMTITGISNENGVAGDVITITGTNFVVLNNVIFPGNIPGTNLTVQNVNTLTVTVPPGITAPDSLRINGVLGSATAPQLFDTYITYPSPGYLATFEGAGNGNTTDNTGFVNWTGGFSPAGNATYPGGTGAAGFLANAVAMSGNNNPGSQGNPGFLQLNDVPWIANTATPIAGYSLKFEYYSTLPWSAGEIWIMEGDWYAWHNYLVEFAPWKSAPGGIIPAGGWTTATIPLTSFMTVTGGSNSDNNEWDLTSLPTGGSPAVHFSDFAATSLCFTLVNDQASPGVPANGMNVAIDNVRIVWGQ